MPAGDPAVLGPETGLMSSCPTWYCEEGEYNTGGAATPAASAAYKLFVMFVECFS